MGGFAGRLKHFYETDSTIDEIIESLDNIVEGKTRYTEKLDGLAITAIFNNEGVRFARNKSQHESGGLNLYQFEKFYKDHPAEKSFIDAANFLDIIWADARGHNFDIVLDKDVSFNFEILDSNRPNIIRKYPKEYKDSISYIMPHLNKDSENVIVIDMLKGILSSTIFPGWKFMVNYSRPLLPMGSADMALYDCRKYDLYNCLKYSNNLFEEVIKTIMEKTNCSEEDAHIGALYIYGKTDFTGRALLKYNKDFKLFSSKEKARVFVRDTFADLHEKIKEIGCLILEYSGMCHQNYIDLDGFPWTEGIVFSFKEGYVKLTGRFQEFNSTQGNYKND